MSSSEVNNKEQAIAQLVDYLLLLLRLGLKQIIRPGQNRGQIDYLLHKQKLDLAELFSLHPNIVFEKEYQSLMVMAQVHGFPFDAPDAVQAYQEAHDAMRLQKAQDDMRQKASSFVSGSKSSWDNVAPSSLVSGSKFSWDNLDELQLGRQASYHRGKTVHCQHREVNNIHEEQENPLNVVGSHISFHGKEYTVREDGSVWPDDSW